MSFLQDITALLKPLAPGSAWKNNAPASAMTPDANGLIKPFIVFTRIVHTDENDLDGPTGLANVRLQVDYIAQRAADSDALRLQGDAAFKRWPIKNLPISLQDLDDPSVGLSRVMREYSIWYQETDDVQAYQSTLYAPGVGRNFSGALGVQWTHQLVVSATSGSASAAGVVEGTDDLTGMTGWTTVCDLEATDQLAGSPTPPVATHLWALLRHRLTAVTGTGAIAQFNSTGA